MPAATIALPGVAIVGGGPAGLMAAETLRAQGIAVDLFEAKGSVGRKFLIAGKGGLNLTHSEPRPHFDARYDVRAASVGRWLDAFDAEDLREWARGLGIDTYIGSSRRVFPTDRKAAPLLRGWVRRLREQGVRFHVHHRWLGWSDDGALRFASPTGTHSVHASATVLALGGASWPELGSDGAWAQILGDLGVEISPLRPANCGFDTEWSDHLSSRHAGAPLKPVIATVFDDAGLPRSQQGECVLSTYGIEGSLIYALSAQLRERIARDGDATLWLDLAPGTSLDKLGQRLSSAQGKRSLSEHLRRQAGIDRAKVALVFEAATPAQLQDPMQLAALIKHYPVRLTSARPVAEAISTAGGVRLEGLDDSLQIKTLPGVFCAGEMLDWEAPTGGFLLTACFASGRVAGLGAAQALRAI